jgi:hypothetical protein
LTVPFPLPSVPLVTVIHEALLVAVQVHPACEVTVIAPDAAPAAIVAPVGEIVNVHGTPA